MTHVSTVGVTLFCINATIFDNILEGIIHEATLTGVVTLLLRAIHQVLLTERHKFSCLQGMLTLQRTSSTKRPTAATLTL